MSGDPDDPFGRRGADEVDAFGRPIDRGHGGGEGSLWSGREEQASEAPASSGWLPPTDAAPAPVPSAPAPRTHGGFDPPTDAAAPDPAWWAGSGTDPLRGARGLPARAGVPAEWLERAGAALVDGLVRLGIVGVGVLVGALGYLAGGAAGDAALTVGLGVGVLAGWAYAPWMIATRNGQTVGHRAVRTRIVRRDEGPLGGGPAVVREIVVKGLLFEAILLWITLGIGPLLNYLWPLWDDRNEALHDKMCNTRVLKA